MKSSSLSRKQLREGERRLKRQRSKSKARKVSATVHMVPSTGPPAARKGP
jgi:hypothetical protein